jgi:hypothetical protein
LPLIRFINFGDYMNKAHDSRHRMETVKVRILILAPCALCRLHITPSWRIMDQFNLHPGHLR